MESPNKGVVLYDFRKGKGICELSVAGKNWNRLLNRKCIGKREGTIKSFGIIRHYQFKDSKVLQNLYFLIKSIAFFCKQYVFGLFGSSVSSCRCQKIGKDFLSVHKLLNVEWVITSCGRKRILYGKCVLAFESCEF